MKVELLDITQQAELKIGRYAGICYNSKTDEASCIRRVKHCKDSGHLATLRFAYATFHVSGISRICSHQFVRSKHLDFLQRSQRYCNDDGFGFAQPPSLSDMEPGIKHNWALIEQHCKDLYSQCISSGMKKEDARFILPQASETELTVVGNFQAWIDFIKLRADKHAQWEIREVAYEIKRQLAQHAPNVFGE